MAVDRYCRSMNAINSSSSLISTRAVVQRGSTTPEQFALPSECERTLAVQSSPIPVRAVTVPPCAAKNRVPPVLGQAARKGRPAYARPASRSVRGDRRTPWAPPVQAPSSKRRFDGDRPRSELELDHRCFRAQCGECTYGLESGIAFAPAS